MTVAVAVLQEEMVSFVLELASSAGFGQVAENLGVSEDDLEMMLAGQMGVASVCSAGCRGGQQGDLPVGWRC